MIHKYVWYAIIAVGFMGMYFMGRNQGETYMGLQCMEIIANREVQKSEIRKNNSSATKDDSEALYNLSLMMPAVKPSATPTPHKESQEF